MIERTCETCQSELADCWLSNMDCYRPRPFWMPSERAGLKAMGEEIKSCQKWQGPGCFEAAIATTRAYVRAAIEVKKERT